MPRTKDESQPGSSRNTSPAEAINDLAVKHNIQAASELAFNIFKDFKKQFGTGWEGVPDDQFVAAALFVACKRERLKAPKSDLVKYSHLKNAGFDLLVAQMQSCYLDQEEPTSPRKRAAQPEQKRQTAKRTKRSDEGRKEMREEVEQNAAVEVVEENEESYEDFKNRILTGAFARLKRNDPDEYHRMVKKHGKEIPAGVLPSK